jgi:hypothetical protein
MSYSKNKYDIIEKSLRKEHDHEIHGYFYFYYDCDWYEVNDDNYLDWMDYLEDKRRDDTINEILEIGIPKLKDIWPK